MKVDDETVWHKCLTPTFPRRTIDGKWTINGQTWRRRRADGKWEYQQDDITSEEWVDRQF